MPKTKIILDFDRVLFDTDALIVGMFEVARRFGATRERFDAAFAQRGDDPVFRLGHFAEQLAPRKADALKEALLAEVADSLWYLYPDARPFLDRIEPLAELNLLTSGDESLQKAKIAATGIGHYFETIKIVEQPKVEAKLPWPTVEHAIFINDNPREMRDLAGKFRWATHLRVHRGEEDADPNLPFETYADLQQLGDRLVGLLDSQVAR